MNATAADLARIPLFASVAEDDLARATRWFDVQEASPGTRLAGEGASGYSFFIIAEGSATVSSDGTELRTLGPGDFFGEIALLGDGRRTATVTAASPVKLFVLFGTEFRDLQRDLPEVAGAIEDAMSRRLSPSS
jgi:CRP-like cAMP-binding protein